MACSVAELSACSLDRWYDAFKAVTIPSRILDLDFEFAEYLLDDGTVYLPPGAEPVWADVESDHSDTEEWTATAEDEDDDVHDTAARKKKQPSFPRFEARIAAAIEGLGGAVLPKLNWSAPRDATWIAATSNMRCTTPGDMYLLLKSSDFVMHDLMHALSECHDYDPERHEPFAFKLVLRKWQPLVPAAEFRCFVHGRRLIAICQRDTRTYYKQLPEMRDEILERITQFFQTHIASKFPIDNFVFDVHCGKGQVLLVDFNPFCDTTDPLLFTWDELRKLAADVEAAAAVNAAAAAVVPAAAASAPSTATAAATAADVAGAPVSDEPTLTDRLNKSLLVALQQSMAAQAPTIEGTVFGDILPEEAAAAGDEFALAAEEDDDEFADEGASLGAAFVEMVRHETGPDAQRPDADDSAAEAQAHAEQLTLTDHLNKSLLQAFQQQMSEIPQIEGEVFGDGDNADDEFAIADNSMDDGDAPSYAAMLENATVAATPDQAPGAGAAPAGLPDAAVLAAAAATPRPLPADAPRIPWLRIHESETAIRPSEYLSYGLPRDLQMHHAQEDLAAIAQKLQQGERPGADSSDDDDNDDDVGDGNN
eukprot:m.70013 g.70013  ORF g.70013 m.70013 type:complete len:594 (+) comp7850_c0_seq2:3-1784(+)